MTRLNRKTRKELIAEKKRSAVKLPVALASINFADGNVGFLIRAAACFGAERVLIVGTLPSQRDLKMLSVGLHEHIEIIQFSRPGDLLKYCREVGYHLVSLELASDARSIYDYQFRFDMPTCIVAGHETVGVPGDILFHSDVVYIPMPGVGRCLNTSQSANVALFEYSRQYVERARGVL